MSLPFCFVLPPPAARTLFKFVRKFEDALSGPCAPSLVEEGSGAGLDSIDANPDETPIHRVHQALKSALPGKGRKLQAGLFNTLNTTIMCTLYTLHHLKLDIWTG